MTNRTADLGKKLATLASLSVSSAETILWSDWILSNVSTVHSNVPEDDQVANDIVVVCKQLATVICHT